MTDAALPLERLFSMPAFEGVRAARAHMLDRPGLSFQDAVGLVKRLELDAASLDLDASQALAALIPRDLANDGPHFYRGCIRGILLAFRPPWARIMLQGKSRLYQAMQRDEQSLLRQAGWLDDPPDPEFVLWWDALNTELRFITSLEKLNQGRAAEKLSIDLETERLRGLGITELPKWTGLDDNTKGYDITSYELENGVLVNKLIEVKSSTTNPLKYIVTRNEWNVAARTGHRYLFHIWDMRPQNPVVHVRTVEQVRPHIPQDNERGQWKDAEILLGAS